MKFSVIYSVDVPEGGDVFDHAPLRVAELWDETEGEGQYDYGCLEGRWEDGRHCKWWAILDREQFDDFVEDCGRHA